MENQIYNFSVTTLHGSPISLEQYRGKVLLIVNTASKCGLTPQYEGLELLYKKYKGRNFVVLGFPCNQFANQEPGDNTSIAEGCLINYGVTFPLFSKIDVNGAAADPLYIYLRASLPGFLGDSIKWNFTKFLVGSNGKPLKRFSPTTPPEKIDRVIAKML